MNVILCTALKSWNSTCCFHAFYDLTQILKSKSSYFMRKQVKALEKICLYPLVGFTCSCLLLSVLWSLETQTPHYFEDSHIFSLCKTCLMLLCIKFQTSFIVTKTEKTTSLQMFSFCELLGVLVITNNKLLWDVLGYISCKRADVSCLVRNILNSRLTDFTERKIGLSLFYCLPLGVTRNMTTHAHMKQAHFSK